MTAPGGISEVLLQLLKNMVDNPVNALLHADYIGILVWAVGMGIALRQGAEHTRQVMADFSHGITLIIQAVIRLAPVGIFGLVASTIATNGTQVLAGYAHLLLVLIGCMLFIALVVNPAIVWWKLRRNPYPLVLMCLRESGVTAFFTRSSAANIPVNLAIAQRLNLDPHHQRRGHPPGGHDQYGGRGHHHQRADTGRCEHHGHGGGCAYGTFAVCGLGRLRLWCLGGARRLAAAHSFGLLVVWHFQ